MAAQRTSRRASAAAGAATFLAGCEGQQSALAPAGLGASDAAVLFWVMTAGGTAIFLLVLALLLYAVLWAPDRRRQLRPLRLVIGGGVLLPVVTLSVLLGFSVNMGTSSYAALPDGAPSIVVKGRQWWWQVEYADRDGGKAFATANEIWIPAGEPVELLLDSLDVIHSLWIPRLAGKLDLVPGRRNRLVVQAETPGVYRAQCAEFCGLAHAQMALYVIAVPRPDYDAWVARQRQPAATPEPGPAVTGAGAFAVHGCGLCHTVRGHGAWGRGAPDLTHVGSRKTIGAGVLSLSAEHIALWISRNQEIKPGNRMPEFIELDRSTRLAIGAYLEGLR